MRDVAEGSGETSRRVSRQRALRSEGERGCLADRAGPVGRQAGFHPAVLIAEARRPEADDTAAHERSLTLYAFTATRTTWPPNHRRFIPRGVALIERE